MKTRGGGKSALTARGGRVRFCGPQFDVSARGNEMLDGSGARRAFAPMQILPEKGPRL
jgi:hypothetical protein